MTQMELLNPCRVPENRAGQCYRILMELKTGERLTVAKALSRLGCYALSQRVGQLKREYGWPIKSRMVEVNPGVHVAEYWLD